MTTSGNCSSLVLPGGARWAGDNRKAYEFPARMRLPWWRLYGQTTVYSGRAFTPVVYCDTTAIADAVIASHCGRSAES